jgi:hypothetical protein
MPNYRERVLRLLRQQPSADVLNDLFLMLRERSYGYDTVKEIGDFVAHRNERDKGIATLEVKDWYSTVAFHVEAAMRPPPINRFPATALALMAANLRRMSPAYIKENTGLNIDRAKQVLRKIEKATIRNANGTLSFQQIRPGKQANLA